MESWTTFSNMGKTKRIFTIAYGWEFSGKGRGTKGNEIKKTRCGKKKESLGHKRRSKNV